ncbi:DegT/DnrJ/EryC1/StrS family aminotransferase [Salinigranum halophilum]|uniref:DegT/DnrJ/EryC1/StrS family aminotransferase n=1 Tax=Salinigranum halophilum TaxID=2565931 RepID=UPI00115D4541|nr:DegT/DnrJ/EryC1/StrS family aminotransferase [Salinigranum halophilum]
MSDNISPQVSNGTPSPIPLFEIDWDRAEIQNAVDSITRGGYWANGPYVDEFEHGLESSLGVQHAVVCNSGTTALTAALEACGIGHGDEVIVPSFTFISTANAVVATGATPVFADIEPERYGLDPDSVEARLTADTAAIVPVHYAGRACRIHELARLVDDHDLTLIEDAAEAQGARAAGEYVGTIGDVGMLSFCQNKIVATGEGGAVVTDDDELAERVGLLRSHGRVSGDYFGSTGGGEYTTLGSNYRMPDIVAALGVAQLDRIEDLVARRRAVAHAYTERLAAVDGVTPPADGAGDERHVYQLYTVRFAPWVDRDAVAERLAEHDIASKVYFDPAHLSTYYRTEHDCEPGTLPVTEDLSSRVLSLPMHPNLSEPAVERVVTTLSAALDEQR